MNSKILIPVIAVVSVAVMIIWGTIAGSYEHSWLAVFAGGIIITIVSVINNTKKKK